MSKQIGFGNLANILIQSQPDIQPSLKNQNPLNQLLNLTALNSITPMETDLQEKYRSLTTKSLEHPTTSPLNIPTTNNTSKHTLVAQDHTQIPLNDLNLADPPHLIGPDYLSLSKLMTREMQQANISPSKTQNVVSIRAKRKLEEKESPTHYRALNLTKVGSSILKLESQLNCLSSLKPQQDKKRKIKFLAREKARHPPCSLIKEVTHVNSRNLIDVESLTSKKVEEADLITPQPKP